MKTLEDHRAEAAEEGHKPPEGFRIDESSPEVREMRALGAKVDRLTNAVLGALGGKPLPPDKRGYIMASAETDADRLATRRARHDKIVARMLPKKGAPVAESPTAEGAPRE